MRIWGKIFKDTHLLRDAVVEDFGDDTRTHKIFRALEELCRGWDLGVPIWLASNIDDFKRMKKTRCTQDSFIEAVDFDYLEFQIIEE